jgi:hypothetical protein
MELAPAELLFAYSVASIRHAAADLPPETLSVLRPVAEARDDALVGFVQDPPSAPRTFTRGELCSAAASVAEANSLPIPFFANLIQQESGWKPHVVSPAGAQGIAQFMPRVARAYGLTNPFDPIHALAVSGKFLRELLQQFGNLGLAAAAYNAGPKRVQDWMAKRGKLPAETRDYVRNITGHPAERWANANAQGLKLPPLARCPDAVTREAQALERAKPEVKVVHVVAKTPQAPAKKVFILASAPPGKQVTVAPKSAMAAKVAAKPALTAKLAAKPALAAKAAPKTTLKITAAEKSATPVRVAAHRAAPRSPIRQKPDSRATLVKLASAKPVAKADAAKKVPAKPATGKRVKFAAASRGS